MKKKSLAVVLAAMMAMSLAACGNDAATNESQSASADATSTGTSTEESGDYQLDTIKIVVNGTVIRQEAGQEQFVEAWEKAVSEKMGYPIKLEIQQLDHSGYADGVGRLFASGDYPDAMLMNADLVKQYAGTGILWDMSEAYKNAEFQNRMELPKINENMMTSDGALYCFSPQYGNGCVTYIKKLWLDNVGINVDDIKTFDDYYNMLMVFHNGDPDGNGVDGDTYGVIAAGYLGNEAPYINYLPEFWQDAYPAILQGDDGVWYDGFQTDATKAALLRLQKGAQDGAIDPETFTASTKIAREKWFSNDQTGSAGVFTYWAGTWYQNLTDNLNKNNVDSELVQLPPIAEVEAIGGYLNREAGGWCIIDDGDGNNDREQAIFDALLDTMLDGGDVQTLWTYGVEDLHWSTKAEEFTLNAGTDKEKTYSYEEGQFHLKPSPEDPTTLWKKNHIDPALVIAPLTNGYNDASELAVAGNKFFTEHCVDAPLSPSSETYTNESGTLYDAKMAAISSVVVEGGDVDAAMEKYVATVGTIVDQILSELNQ